MNFYRTVLFFLVAMIFSFTSFANQFNKQQVKEIEHIVHHYLVNNPQVLIEASRVLQKQQSAEAQKASESAVAKYADKIFATNGRPVAGNADGNIIMVEYFDYQCPHCKVMGPAIENLIKDNPKLKVIFAEWPIFGGNSLFAAKAALAAMKQNKYYPLHMALTDKGYPVTKEDVLALAKQAGVDIDKMQKDMDDPAIMDQLKANYDIARDIKIIGTPAFIVANTKTHKYRYFDGQTSQEELQKIINEVK